MVIFALLSLFSLLLGPAYAGGTVTMPLSQWQALRDNAAADEQPEPPPVPVLHRGRSVAGSFRKGVFSGTLNAQVEVLPGSGHQRVPILDSATSIGAVELDGQPASLLREGGMYTIGIDEPGVHRVVVQFFQGRENDRFARRLGTESFELNPPLPQITPQIVAELRRDKEHDHADQHRRCDHGHEPELPLLEFGMTSHPTREGPDTRPDSQRREDLGGVNLDRPRQDMAQASDIASECNEHEARANQNGDSCLRGAVPIHHGARPS